MRDEVISGLDLASMSNAEKEQVARRLCQQDHEGVSSAVDQAIVEFQDSKELP